MTTAPKHSQTPWTVDHLVACSNVYDRYGRLVAQVHQKNRDGIGFKEREANADIIVAAAEMATLLAELIDIEGPQPGTAAWAAKVRALLQKIGWQP